MGQQWLRQLQVGFLWASTSRQGPHARLTCKLVSGGDKHSSAHACNLPPPGADIMTISPLLGLFKAITEAGATSPPLSKRAAARPPGA